MVDNLLVIDAENIKLTEMDLVYIGCIYPIDEILIYFDMSKNNISSSYIDWSFKYTNCNLIDVPSINGKNSVDLQITIDVFEKITINKKIKNILIASNDRDFYPLCKKCKDRNIDITMIVYSKIHSMLYEFIKDVIILHHISTDERILLKCFIMERSQSMTLSGIKKMIKKLNSKKILSNYQDLHNIILNTCQSTIFYQNGNYILKYKFLI
jgi:hypothetical protein